MKGATIARQPCYPLSNKAFETIFNVKGMSFEALREVGPVALRPTLSDGLPFSS